MSETSAKKTNIFSKAEIQSYLYEHKDGELICDCGNRYFCIIKTHGESITVTTAFCSTCSHGYFLASDKKNSRTA